MAYAVAFAAPRVQEQIEYREDHKREILPLYQSIGWHSYTGRPEMQKSAYEHSLKIQAGNAQIQSALINPPILRQLR